MLWQIFLILLGLYAMVIRWKNRQLIKISKQLPSKLKRVPVLGHAVNFLGGATDRMDTFKKLGEEAIYSNDGGTSIWLFNKLLVFLGDPESAEVVMKSCLEKDEMMHVSRQLIGNGSIFAPVIIWRPRRKLLAPTFGQKTLNSFVTIFSKQSEILTKQLKVEAGKGEFSIFDYVTKYSMDSVCETALGIQVNTQSIPNHPVPKSFNQFCDIVAGRMLKPWLYSDFIYKLYWDFPQAEASVNVMKQFVSKIIKSKRENMNQNRQNNNLGLDRDESKCEPNVPRSKSFLEILIESGGDKGFTDLELQEESLVMVLAGTDTSSVAASFTALLLAKYPHIQDKLYEEIKEVINDTESSIQASDIPKLKYLDAVVKESLRLYPPVPVIIRKVDKTFTLPSGVTFVPGVSVVIHIWAVHRNPKYWGDDATIFRPERFLEGPLKHPCAFIPFSSGARNCLGAQYAMMSVKTVIAQIIRHYRILPATATRGSSSTDEEIPLKFEVMMKHVDNFEIKLELRK